MFPVSKYNVLGTGVSALTLAQAGAFLVAARGRKGLGYVCATGVHGVCEARRDPAFRSVLNGAWLNVPDGMPLVWLGRWHGHRNISRVYGPDLMLAVCDTGRLTGLTHYFYGGAPGVAEELRAKLTARFAGLRVVGTFTPPFRPLNEAERDQFRRDVDSKRPDVIWIGLSTPKQERFAAGISSSLEAGVLVTVGAAFDFHAGRIRQAPRWMQRSGLEWFFRLCLEPRRLGTRYLVNNPLFILRTGAQLTGLRKYPLAPPSAVN
ncbi:MAG: WecB/TagA/CpsF family glycosyltransferase [Opitutae bacterium]|nr:WecB/TagA/CpsF family glycosyltransferase [Opitutae bacterium]